MKRSSLKKSTFDWKNYIPGRLIASSEVFGWRDLVANDFVMPSHMPDGPAPGIADYSLGSLYCGDLLGEYTLQSDVWRQREARRSEISMLPPGCGVNWRWWPASADYVEPRLFTINLSASLVKRIAAESLDLNPDSIEVTSGFMFQDPMLYELLMTLRNELGRGNPLGPMYAETSAQMLAVHLLSRHCFFKPTTELSGKRLSNNQLKKVTDYIEAHLHADISLTVLAGLLRLSDYHFLRLFKESLGETPLQYVIRLRMEQARRLLAAKRLSITEVALEVGYESVSHFIDLFKRHAGVTPSEYRKNY